MCTVLCFSRNEQRSDKAQNDSEVSNKSKKGLEIRGTANGAADLTPSCATCSECSIFLLSCHCHQSQGLDFPAGC